MYKNLTLKAVIRLVFLVVLSIALLLGGSLFLLLQSQQGVINAKDDLFNYFNKAGMVRLYSTEKSTAIRDYVVTGNPEQLALYMKADDVTEGRSPRVDARC